MPQDQFFPESTRIVKVNNSGVLLANADVAHRIKDGVRERLEPAAGKTEALGNTVLVQTAEGYRAVSRAPGELDTPPDLEGVLLADNGDVHGIKYEGNNRGRPRYASAAE